MHFCQFELSYIFIDEKKEYDTTGCKMYTNVCKALGIIPASHFIRCLQAEDTSVDLTHHYLGPKGTKAISLALTVSICAIDTTIIMSLNVFYVIVKAWIRVFTVIQSPEV